jgi:hypothetical protein
VNYTWSKTLTDAGPGRTEYFWAQEKTLGENDMAHVINGTFVYDLPFGSGRALSPANAVARALVSGWRLSGITRVRTGLPYANIQANCNVPFAGTCFADYNPDFRGSVRIGGDWGSGDLLGPNPPVFLDRNAFRNPAPFTYGNTPPRAAFGLRNPTFWSQDLSVARQFPISERIRLMLQADAFNVFNHVIFSGPASLNINSANFGRVISQANDPRLLQLSLKLQF